MCQKNKRVCFEEIMSWIIIKMKMKNRSNWYDINRPRPRHGLKYTKYEKCLSMMMFISYK